MKKLLTILLSIVIIFCALPFGTLTVSALSEGYYTYTVSNGEAEIIECNSSINGDITIPLTLGGYPVTTIGEYAFRNCNSLTSITISNSVINIRAYAFFGCSGITSIMLSCSTISIGDGAFNNCVGLESITIPDSVTSVGYSAFSGCYSLKSVILSNNITSIKHFTFSGCSNLTNIIIPNNVISIGDTAFYGCSSLKGMIIPKNVTSIGSSAFSGCDSLINITIPNSIKNIGSFAFEYCDNLKNVFYCGTEEEWNNISIDSYNTDLTNAIRNYHNYTTVTETMPSCIENGHIIYKCSICDDCYIDETPALGHSYISTTIQPTCVEDGYTKHICTTCADSYISDKIPALGHKTNTNVISTTNSEVYPFAFDDGIYSSTNKVNASSSVFTITALINCKLKIQYKTSSEDNYDKLTITHNSDVKVTASGIDENWKTIVLNLSKGDNVYIKYAKDSTVNKGEDTGYFKFDCNDVDNFESTCENSIACGVCGITFKPATGHSYDNDCDMDCNVCGKTRTTTHIYDSDCDITCNVCGIVRTINHTYITTTILPTCIENGYTSHVCSVCGDNYVDEISAIGHDYEDEFTTDKVANDFEEGSKSRHCTRCNAVTDIITIPKVSIVDGTCGDSVLWAITKEGILKFKGSGATYNYNFETATPWYDYSSKITTVEIDENITNIGNFYFYSLSGLEKVIVNNSDMTFGKRVFKSGTTSSIYAKGGSTVEAFANSNNITFIKPKNPETPILPELLYRSGYSVILKVVVGYEYSIDGVNWQQSSTFENLKSGTSYNFYQRITEGVYAPSVCSEKLTVITLSPPTSPTVLSVEGSNVTLNYIDGHEYSMDGITWQKNNIFLTVPFDKVLCFYARKAANGSDLESPVSEATKILNISAPKVFVGFDTLRVVSTEGYEYSLDGRVWYNSNYFEVIDGEEYTVYHRPKNTYGITVFTNESTTVFTNGRNAIENPTAEDLVWLKKQLLFFDDQNNLAADVNTDDIVNILDFICLNKQIVQDKVEFEGEWVFETVSNEYLYSYSLSNEGFICGIGDPLSKMDEELQNELRQYPEDIKLFDGEEYYFGRGEGWEIVFTRNDGENITFECDSWGEEYLLIVTMQYVDENTLKITSLTDENALFGIAVGTAFIKQ